VEESRHRLFKMYL